MKTDKRPLFTIFVGYHDKFGRPSIMMTRRQGRTASATKSGYVRRLRNAGFHVFDVIVLRGDVTDRVLR